VCFKIAVLYMEHGAKAADFEAEKEFAKPYFWPFVVL
jgi:hypothetical protein